MGKLLCLFKNMLRNVKFDNKKRYEQSSFLSFVFFILSMQFFLIQLYFSHKNAHFRREIHYLISLFFLSSEENMLK